MQKKQSIIKAFKNNCPISAVSVLEEDKKLNHINNSSYLI